MSAAAIATPPASAEFGPRFGISTRTSETVGGAYVDHPATVRIDAVGNAILAWQGPVVRDGPTAEEPAVWARLRRADGTLDHRRLIGRTEPASAYDFDLHETGGAWFAWANGFTSYGDPDRSWKLAGDRPIVGGPKVAAYIPPGWSSPRIAAVWISPDASGLERVMIRQKGTVIPVNFVSDRRAVARDPQFAVNAAGEGLIAWTAVPPTGPTRIMASAFHQDASFSAPVTLSEGSRAADSPVVDVDAGGQATIVWRTTGTDERMHVRRRALDGTLSDVRTLVATPLAVNRPAVAVNPAGTAVAVWQRDDGTSRRIDVRAMAPDGTLSERNTLTPPGGSALTPSVAIDPAGRSVIGWHRRIVYLDGNPAYVPQARRRAADGTLSPIETLYRDPQAGRTQHADSVLVKVAMDPAGNALAVWTRNDPDGWATILGALSPAP